MPVVGLLAPKVEGTENEVCILSEITAILQPVIDYIQGRVPTFQLRYSKTAGQRFSPTPARVVTPYPVTFISIQSRGRLFSRQMRERRPRSV